MEPKETDVLTNPDDVKCEDEDVVKNAEPAGISFKDISEMADSIDRLGRSVEMQRQIVDANERLADSCYQLGLSKETQDFIESKLRNDSTTDEEFAAIVKDKDKLDELYFTKEDGKIITFDSNVCQMMSMTEYDLKVDFISELRTFYKMEADTQKAIDDINQSIEEFKFGEISELSSTIANNFRQSLDERCSELENVEDLKERKRREKLISRMRSGYTFDAFIEVLEKYPSIVKNTLIELKRPQMIKDTGSRYNAKRLKCECVSSLIPVIRDDTDKSLERLYMAPGDYVEGYENLFGYFAVRFFSKEDWTSRDVFTKEMHNSMVIILTNLIEGNLDKEFREEVLANISKVWAIFKKSM